MELFNSKNNKACKVHGIGTIKLKMFDDREFFLRNERYVSKLKRIFFSIRIFDDLCYNASIEFRMLKIYHGAFVMAKGSNM